MASCELIKAGLLDSFKGARVLFIEGKIVRYGPSYQEWITIKS